VAYAKQAWNADQVHFISLRAGETRSVQVKGHFLSGFDWAPDSKSIFVGSPGANGATLLHVDLKGGVQPIWQQSYSSDIWGIPSPDGRHLALVPTRMCGSLTTSDSGSSFSFSGCNLHRVARPMTGRCILPGQTGGLIARCGRPASVLRLGVGPSGHRGRVRRRRGCGFAQAPSRRAYTNVATWCSQRGSDTWASLGLGSLPVDITHLKRAAFLRAPFRSPAVARHTAGRAPERIAHRAGRPENDVNSRRGRWSWAGGRRVRA
jgi:hypothetical protein